MKKIITFCFLIVALTSCTVKVTNNIHVDTSIAFEIIKQDAYGGRDEKSNVIITSQQKLEAIYKELGWNEVPKVDFNKNNVVALFMGQQNSGGYSIAIKSIVVEDDTTIIKVLETKPEGMATMALTAPYCIAIIPKTDKVIVE